MFFSVRFAFQSYFSDLFFFPQRQDTLMSLKSHYCGITRLQTAVSSALDGVIKCEIPNKLALDE